MLPIKIRSSKLARYMVCAGYMHLDLVEPEAGEPAREGTAAGEWLQGLLENKALGLTATNGVYFDNDMKFFTQPIADKIKAKAYDQVLCETRIDWQTASGIWIRGQYDAAFEDHRGYLCIDDLKYGWGIIEVKNNWQLISYAIGEVIRRGKYYSHIALTIHQPRPHHEDGESREWIITYEELLGFKQQIEDRMTALANGLKNFQTGPSCKYCAGAAEACTAFSRLYYRALEISTEFHQDSLTEVEIAAQLDQIKRAEEVIKIKLDSLVELSTSRIKAGKIIPGYIQENKVSQRTWKHGVTPEAIKTMTGVDVMEKQVMSPAKAEKLISKDFVKTLTETRFAGVRLVKKNGSDVGNKIFGTQDPTGGFNL